jgi:hypothetical protein
VISLLLLVGCAGADSGPSATDIRTAFTNAGASNVVVVPASTWQAAFAQAQLDGVPVEGAQAEMAHIDGEVGGTFGQSLFLIQMMDSDGAAKALARGLSREGQAGNGAIVSEVLVNGRLVGTYAGDPAHAAMFASTFNDL